MKQLMFLLAILFFAACNQDAPPATAEATTPEAPAKPAIDATVLGLFEEVNVVKMHLFASGDAEPKADYPYIGKAVEEANLKFLATDIQPNEIGSVYACYRSENNDFFVLRVPGKYASNSLVLAKWDANSSKLVKVMDLASLQCDEGYCIQQDAWLTDLDDDRSLEIVTRGQTDDNGKISEETFTVLAQQPPGSFTPAPAELAALAPKTSYVLN